MLNRKGFIFMLIALAGSAASAQTKKADSLEDVSFAALEKRVALNAMRKEVVVEPAKWPKGDVKGLDFTKAGNAIIVHHESGQLSNPFAALTEGVAFKLFHLEDDPYRLTPRARGIGIDKGEDKSKYRSDKYKPTLQQMQRAKYVLFVAGKVQEPKIDLGGKSFTPGKLEAACVLYEIESKKLLGGLPLEARNSDNVSTRTGGYRGQELDALMHDFENNARAALWKALKARFPSAKLPTIVYLDSKE
ncbi:MAG: hypothetical protein ACREVG_08065 [Burkholderiales bacterium]